MRQCDIHADVAIGRVVCLLREGSTCASLIPGDTRRDVQVDVDSVSVAEVRAYAVIGRELWECAGAARPFLLVVKLCGVSVIIRVVIADSVRLNQARTQDRVIEHCFHAIAIATVSRYTHQVTGDFKMSVGATRCFKTAVALNEAVCEFVSSRVNEAFVGAPAAC